LSHLYIFKISSVAHFFCYECDSIVACERVVMSKSKLVDKNVTMLQLLSKKLSEHRRLGPLSVNFRLSEDEVEVLGKFGKHLLTKIGLCWDEGLDGRVRIQGNSTNILPCLQEV